MPEPSSSPNSPQYVPYQAYKPKRHSRNLSTATVAIPPASRPSSIVVSPVASPLLRVLADEDKDSIASLSLAAQGTPPSNGMSFRPSTPHSPAIRIELAPDHVQPPPPLPPAEIATVVVQGPTASNAPDVTAPRPTEHAPTSSSHPSPALSTQTLSPHQSPVPKARKVSTFRRLTPRPASTAPSLQPNTHSRNVSTASLPASPASPMSGAQTSTILNDRPRTTSLRSPSVKSPLSPLKPLPNLPPETSRPSSSARPAPQPEAIDRSASTASQSTLRASPSPSATEGKLKSAPYRPGFQPKGVYRPRTDEFLAIRRVKREGEGEEGRLKRIERTKLERRLEKLIALHFPPADSKTSEKGTPLSPGLRKKKDSAPGATVRRASSFFDLEKVKNLKLSDPGELWRGVIASGMDPGGKEDIRATEQRITPWEEDSAVSKCPLCSASFHPLTNRKHHCRLCGKIICSLPPKSPQRPLTCSLLFVVDSKSRQIEEVGEGVDYGVRRRNRPEGEDKFLRAVRICRSCRPVLIHQQYSQQVREVPIFCALYDVFINLEREIEDALPQFQELLLSLSHDGQPTKEASAARKRLLEAFAQYDRLSKQIRALPCPGGPGSSQDRIQASILARANLFLQKNMFPLQSLPRPSMPQGAGKANGPKTDDGLDIDPDSELARTLQPLLEQEALLESFIGEAKAQRKFEDVKTLKLNQNEIRREIERLLDNADIIQGAASGRTSTRRA
ncbi:hypothetical protein CC2G_005767 [Coprinopsis cinerea AmutBmut pab1-1]|nr:hypothetical protein CC2G_005767 [Coprinopsis cinerea AmutBmut pab1-1]